ncbi:uracil-DNA glycosylase [Candidatus Uhrbacteria bacterium]|nr:uracil-DNA glycosylase [Candidatus Uhrbacteria bacterium]
MTTSEKTRKLREIRDEVLNLKASPLYAERVKNKVFPVLGEGSHDAEVMFIGEAPGRNEAANGRPFCGAAGHVLDGLLASIQVDRRDVYVTNIVKDRPPNNRDPLPEEIEIYAPFLIRQIEVIQPKVIATLGRFSMQYLMPKFGLEREMRSISQIHGTAFNTATPYGAVTFIPLLHPAVTLYNSDTREQLFMDFQKLKRVIKNVA